MPFDYQAALKAGKTKEQVLNYLAKTRNISESELKKQWLPKGQDFTLRALARFNPQETQPVQELNKPQGGVSGFFQNLLGSEKLTRGLGARIASMTPEGKKNLETAQSTGQLSEQQAQELATGGVTGKQMLGSALQTGATIASLGIGGATAGTSKAAFKSILPMAAKVGTAGAVAGFGAGLSENKSVTDSLKQAFTTGLASAATAGTLSAVGKLGKLGLEKLPTKIYQSTAKLEEKSAKALLDAKQFGTLGRLQGFVKTEGGRLDDLIQQKIAQNNGQINSKQFMDSVISQIKNKYQGYSEKQITTALKNAGIDPFFKNKTVDFLTADNIRKSLGATEKYLDKTKFGIGVKDILWKELVNTYRKPTGTEKLFEQWAPIVNASKSIAKTIKNQEGKMNIKLSDWIVGLGAGIPGGGISGIGAVAIKKAAESPLAKTTAAVGLNELNKVIDRIPATYFDKAGKISRSGLVKALSEITK